MYNGYFALMQAKGAPDKVKAALEQMQKGIQFFEDKFTAKAGKEAELKMDFMGG